MSKEIDEVQAEIKSLMDLKKKLEQEQKEKYQKLIDSVTNEMNASQFWTAICNNLEDSNQILRTKISPNGAIDVSLEQVKVK
jgi:hypothetical protein